MWTKIEQASSRKRCYDGYIMRLTSCANESENYEPICNKEGQAEKSPQWLQKQKWHASNTLSSFMKQSDDQ